MNELGFGRDQERPELTTFIKEGAMGNRLNIKEVERIVFDCQTKVAVVYETIRSISQRYFDNERDPNVEHCCLVETESSLKELFETLRDLSNRSPWENGDAVEMGMQHDATNKEGQDQVMGNP